MKYLTHKDMFKLTENQLNALLTLKEDRSLPLSNAKVHKNVLNSLGLKNLVKLCHYANGWHWELSELGEEEIRVQNTNARIKKYTKKK